MTCIVGLVEGNSVWMGADRAQCGQGEVSYRATPKLFRSGPYLLGGAGSARCSAIARHVFEAPEPQPGDNLDRFMQREFATALWRCHADLGAVRSVDGESQFDGILLVALLGRLYLVFGDYQALRVDDFEAIGSGGQVARGALYASRGRPAEERVRLALEAAERFDTGVRGPFDVEHVASPALIKVRAGRSERRSP